MVKWLLNLQILSPLDRKDTLATSIRDGGAECDLEDLEEIDETIEASKIPPSLIDKLFRDLDGEKFVLDRDDTSVNDILVDPTTFQITGIVDWEHVSFQLLWEAVRAPQLVDGPEVNAVALRENFGVDIPLDPLTCAPLILDALKKETRINGLT